jgi:hypothetical protein
MPERNLAGDDKAQLTGAGCVLTLLTLAVIVGVAIPIVRSGPPLPQEAAICAPFIIGAFFFGISSALLRLVGLRVWSKPEKEGKEPEPNAAAAGGRDPGSCFLAISGERMGDLRARARAFIDSPHILGEASFLILRYYRGELLDDPDAPSLLSRSLQTARVAAARGDTLDPAGNPNDCYQRAAELLADILAEVDCKRGETR